MQKTINERIKEVIDNSNFKSVSAFAKANDIPQTTLSDCINKGNEPKFGLISKIHNAEPLVSLEWLLTGKGEMYSKNKREDKPENTNTPIHTMNEPLADYLPTSNFKLLPLQSFDVAGGSNNQESDTMGYVMGYMPFVNAKDGDIAVLVTGNSMYPTYPSGSYVQIRRIDYWQKFVEFGQVHIIELLDDRRLIKEVRKGSDKEHFKLISHNTNFDEVEVPTDFIRSVWLVLAKYEKSTM